MTAPASSRMVALETLGFACGSPATYEYRIRGKAGRDLPRRLAAEQSEMAG